MKNIPVSFDTGSRPAVSPCRSIALGAPAVVPSNERMSMCPSRQARYSCPESMNAPRMSAEARPTPETAAGAPTAVPSNVRRIGVAPAPTV